jgi:ATP-dependent RNA helicase RhlE
MLALRGGADVLVATPGRLLDLAGKNAARLGAVEILVLDEADRMLNLGFRDELSAILALLPPRRQTLLFSATMSEALESISEAAIRDPLRLEIGDMPAPGLAANEAGSLPRAAASTEEEGIEELAYAVGAEVKGPFLRRLIAEGGWERVLVFASSNRRADNVARKLNNNGIAALAFHGDLSQAARNKALGDFRAGKIRVLVASDLASRGLDIEGLPCVVNYELPRSPLDYVHRIGRTGRAGARGLAVSLVSPGEEAMLHIIEKKSRRRIRIVREGCQ